MKILLIGSRGYVGTEFCRHIGERGWECTNLRRLSVDTASATAFGRILSDSRPDCLINCAGYTGKPNVDACELDKANCLLGNAVLPGFVAEICSKLSIPLGHISSGCIFTGSREDGSGFREIDAPNFTFRQNNCSFYSGTKALGEEVLSDFPDCYIWRLRIPFSNIDSSRNYLSKLIRYQRLLQAENSLSNLPEFVAACLDCIEKRLPFGIYNLTNPGHVTTSEVVRLIQESGVCTRDFEFFDSETEFMQKAARTPRSNCILDSSKAIASGLRLTPVKDSIRDALRNWVPETAPDSP